MGRPIKKLFIGNRNTGSASTDADNGIGGESLASVALGTAGSAYSQGLTATVSAPQLPTGVTATISVAVHSGNGAIQSYTVTEAGSGYTSAPTVTLVPASDAVTDATFTTGSANVAVVSATGISVGMRATSTNITSNQTVLSIDGTTVVLSAVPDGNGTDEEVTFSDEGTSGVAGTRTLTTTTQNAIAVSAFVVGGSSAVAGDIQAQKGSKTYRVVTAQGTSECLLVTGAPAEGQMRITATDSAGGTYYVKKLTNNTVVVLPGTGTQFDEDDKVLWADTAVEDVSVSITN